jgi:hypothetical protein
MRKITEKSGFHSWQRQETFLFSTAYRQFRGPIQPCIKWETGPLSLGVKHLGHKSKHSSPSSADIVKTSMINYRPFLL